MSARSTTIRPRPRAVPGTGLQTGGGAGVGHAAAFSPLRARRLARVGYGPRSRRPPPAFGILSRTRPGVQQPVTEGTVIIIGGAEDKVRDRVILSRFVALAGGARRDDRRHQHGVVARASRPASATSRSSASSASSTVRHDPRHDPRRRPTTRRRRSRVRDATGIFLTGGNQLRLSSTIGGTRLADAILDQFRQGAVVAGTSAGASRDVEPHDRVRGVAGRRPSTAWPRSRPASASCPGVIVDQHFQQRNRLGRLLASSPRTRACSGSASTRTRPASSARTTSWRSSGAARSPSSTAPRSETDAWEVNGHRPLMISGVVLHSLPAGYRFDLRRRERVATPSLHALPGRRGRVELSAAGSCRHDPPDGGVT